MNTIKKGYRNEKEYMKIKESQGYTCYRPPKTKFNKQDILGFDIICFNQKEILLVQVKTNQKRNMAIQGSFTNHPINLRKIQAVKRDRKGWTEYEI